MRRGLVTTSFALFLVVLLQRPGPARTIVISPPEGCGGSEEFEDVANSLRPGDELILRGGVYCQTGARRITCRGTETQPIVIRAADGETPILTRPDDPAKPQRQNGIEIAGEYLILRGLHFKGGDTGVRFLGPSHHITLEDCEISHTSNNGITMNSGDTDSFVIRRNHIHHTGLLDREYGTTEGEGMYVGSHNGSYRASNHLIEGNYIHHLRGTSGGGNDGIEVKKGSWGNVIRHNVIHDTTIGTRYPGIFAYGVSDPSREKPNVIEGNVIWNAGEAILVTADAIVRNNIVFDSDNGIVAKLQSPMTVVRNVTIANNTVVGTSGAALRIRWSDASNVILANNAVYNPGRTAVDARGLERAVVRANVTSGGGVTPDGTRFLAGGSLADAFVDPAARDFWPRKGSPLLGAADPRYVPPLDFNGRRRSPPHDAGAYGTGGLETNPGWKIREGFKEFAGAGTGDSVPPSAPKNVRSR